MVNAFRELKNKAVVDDRGYARIIGTMAVTDAATRFECRGCGHDVSTYITEKS